MPITMTEETSGSFTVDATTGVTASITIPANELCLAVFFGNGSSIGTLSAASTGRTWVQEETQLGGTVRRLSVFRSLESSETTGAITFTCTTTMSRGAWIVASFANTDTSGTSGSGAVVQSVPASGTNVTTLSITLAAFGSIDNATYGVFGINSSTNPPYVIGTGFTEINTRQGPIESALMLLAEWRNDNDTSVDYTGGNATDDPVGIAIEIKFAGGDPESALVGGKLLYGGLLVGAGNLLGRRS